MTDQRNRGSAGARPALVIDGEAVLVARHARAKPLDGAAWAPEPNAAEASTPHAHAARRSKPQPARRRKPPTPDLVFQSQPRQRFALPTEARRSVLPRSVWIAGLMTLAVLVPLAAISVQDSLAPSLPEVAARAPIALPAAEKPVRILYGIPKPNLAPTLASAATETRLALGGDTAPAPLPGALGGVYPVSAGIRPAGVARLGSVQNVRDMKTAARRTPTE